MSMLEFYARRAQTTIGLEHLAALRALRSYIKQTPDKELLKAIEEWTDLALLRTLVEAGLRRPLLDAVMRKAEELILRGR